MATDNIAPITIVIVNWNAGEQLADAVRSIISYHAGLVSLVAVIDNASSDDSLDNIKAMQDLPFPVQIVRNALNMGFAAACNQGAEFAESEFILFLNPDTRLFPDSLSKTVAFMQNPDNTKIGICGIRLLDEQGNFSTSASRFPTLSVVAGKILGLNKLLPSMFPAHLMASSDLLKNDYVDQVIGAYFLIRKSVFIQCAGFDERFFVYFEEVDLSLRAKRLGYASYFLADVSAFHKGGGCSAQVKAGRLFYSLRSRIYYAQKHYSKPEFVALILLTAIELPLRLAQAVLRRSSTDIKNTCIAYRCLVSYFANSD